MKKTFLILTSSLFLLVGCGGSGRSGGFADLSGRAHCEDVATKLSDVKAFAPTEYCAALSTYLKFNSDYTSILGSDKKTCEDVAELKTEIDDIDIDTILSKFVSAKLTAAGITNVTNYSQLIKHREIMLALYDAIVPSVSAAVGNPPLTCSSLSTNILCKAVRGHLFAQIFFCSTSVPDADARDHFVKAFAKYLHGSGMSTKTEAVLEASLSAILDPASTLDDQLVDEVK